MNVEVNPDALAELKKKLTPLNAGKIIFGALISLGATAAIIAALRDPLKASKGIVKLLMAAGIFVLACKAGDVAEEHFKETVDNWAETIKDIKNEMKEEGDETHGNNTHAGRDSKQQPEKQRTGRTETTKAAGSTVRRRWWSKKERDEQILEMDEKDVPERQESPGNHEGRGGEPDRSGG